MGFFDKLKKGLIKTKNALVGKIDSLFSSYDKINDDFYDELMDVLITADIGVETADYITEELRAQIKQRKIKTATEAREVLIEILCTTVGEGGELKLDTKPSIIFVIGVNGVGKTTSIGKIANDLKYKGKNVMLAAADTFRAAAIEQLGIWSERAGVTMVKSVEGTDPASVVFDTIASSKAHNADVIICDTAGRLHNKKNLMDELAKINRVINRELPDASVESLLVLDATTGQNAVNQAKEFNNVTDITGIILTKLDGTAKGGIIIPIKNELNIPVKFIGVGEGIDDLQPFNAKEFVNGIFDTEG